MSIVADLRQPEYTGENRCLPCTVVNVAIAAGLGGVVWIVSPPAAVATFLVCGAAIYLRGYLVPGTPTLTKRYFPKWILARFGKAPPVPASEDPLKRIRLRLTGEKQVSDRLLDTGAVERRGDGTLELDSEFERRLFERVSELESGDVTDDDLRAVHPFPGAFDWSDGLVSAEVELENADAELVAQSNEDETLVTHANVWISHVAALTDVAIFELLDGEPSWRVPDLKERSTVLEGIRVLLEECPRCQTTLEESEVTLDSCCSTSEVVSRYCPSCEENLVEVPVS